MDLCIDHGANQLPCEGQDEATADVSVQWHRPLLHHKAQLALLPSAASLDQTPSSASEKKLSYLGHELHSSLERCWISRGLTRLES
eukprot:CAMPEP_0169205258 /NCGR_PEP_ID=MMETSP1016-20121227/12423_1 /TAXON_ID=342587 /ORGANISM="Karlodinium micrum, Strain CCMP2283" /LENGTH=85 /DNA_ID=CAMNT_0009282395 /DNA_START=535 /DNA_END=792 /DNA_ORIENTATION=+